MHIWTIVSAIAAIGVAFLVRAAYRMGRRRAMRVSAAKGVFYVTLLRQGEKVWCRMTGGHVYEIEYLRTYMDQRFYRITRFSLDASSGQVVVRYHPEAFFRGPELKVGDGFMCLPEPCLTRPITEISVTRLDPVIRANEGATSRKTQYFEQAR